MPPRRPAFGLLVAILLGAAVLAPPGAGALDAAYTQADLPDVVTTGAIAQQAAELGHDPVRIYEFVRNEFEYEIYYGLMKGPVATLRTRAGNDYDLAALLVSLLRASNIPARFVRGKVKILGAKSNAWIGAQSGSVAAYILRTTQPPGWTAESGNPPFDFQTITSGGYIETLRIWVEAYVPLGSYRGAGGNANTTLRGPAWVPLDPSFKTKSWNADPGLPIGGATLSFDYDAYYDSVQSELPIEAFEDQMRAYLADSSVSGVESVEDAAFGGKIQKEAAGVLPNALPYELSTVFPELRHARLEMLHRTVQNSGLVPNGYAAVGANGAPDYRYERLVHLCKNGTEDCAALAESHADKVLQARNWSAAWQGQRLTLWFPPTAASAGDLKPVGYAASSCNGVGGVDIWTVPTVSANGIDQATGDPVKLCRPLEGAVEIIDPLGVSRVALPPFDFEIKAGDVYVTSFDEHGTSDADVEAAGTTLSAILGFVPLAHDPVEELAFVDTNRNGTKQSNEIYLAADPSLQQLVTGSLLHLVHTWYWSHARAGDRRAAALHQKINAPVPGLGRVTSGREVEYLFDVPFGIQPSNLLIDLASGVAVFHRQPNAEGKILVGYDDHALRLQIHQLSALEHAVWEEVAGVGAVSTVQGFQLGLDLSESDPNAKIELLRIESFQEAKSEVQARCNANGCNKSPTKGLDVTSFCTIRRSFPQLDGEVLPDPPGWASACEGAFSGATQDLRILNRSNFDYDGWIGSVYARFTTNSGMMAIAPSGGNGGFARDFTIDPLAGSLNGVYDFHLESWLFDTPGSVEVLSNDPVSVTHGSYYETHTDLEVPGPGGLNLRLVRSYNSRLDYDGALGHGWIHTFDQHLRIDPGDPETGDEKVIWVTEDATEVVWNDEVGGLTSEAWNHSDLVRLANGSFTLTTKEGMQYRFLAPSQGIARLDRIVDLNGNTILCQYASGRLDRVIDAAGRALDFDYDFSYFGPWPFTITDWTGREFRYDLDAASHLVEYTDPEGHVWEYEYYDGLSNEDLNHNIYRYRRPAIRGDGRYEMTFAYYPNDSVYMHWDSLGRTTRFSYNFFRKRTDVFNTDGGMESYFYDAYGNVTRYQSAEGHVTEYEFSLPENRNRTREIDALGFETTLSYDSNGNLLSRINRAGDAELWLYNAYSRPTNHFFGGFDERNWVYDANQNLIEERADLDGGDKRLLREHDYDSRGNRIATTEWHDATRSATTTFDYDPVTQFLVKITDAEGNETRIVPDPLGRPLRTEVDRTLAGQLAPVVVERSFDALGRVVSETGPRGLIREVDYDANGFPSQIRSVVPQPGEAGPLVRVEQQHTYDKMDRLVSSVDALGNVTQFAYDERDRRTHVTSPLGRVTETVYDLDGRPVRSVDASGAAAQTDYDPVGRPLRVIDALGRVSEIIYDPEGRVLERSQAGRVVFRDADYDTKGNLEEWFDAAGVPTRQEFDELGRRTELEIGTGSDFALLLFEYDRQGRLLRKTDGNGHETEVAYDDLGRVEVVIDGLARERSRFEYDEVGNVVRVTDGAGKVVERQHDALGQLLSERDVGAGGESRFRYDAYGRLVWRKGPDGATETFAYDELDRVVTRSDAVAGTERFVYDADGLLRQHVQPSGLSGAPPLVLNYAYDARGLLSDLDDPEAGRFEFAYDPLGRPVRRTGPGGGEWRADYTPEGEVDRIQVSVPNGGTHTVDYTTFDARGHPTAFTTSEGATAIAYTPLGRVRRVDYPNAAFEEFSYDDAGNRKSRLDETGTAVTYHYDAADQLTQITAGLTGTGAVLESFDHDGAGRRTRRTAGGAVTDYAYDGLGRLVSVDRTGYSADLAYGASGRRTQRVEGAVTTRYPTARQELRAGASFRLLRGGATGEVVAEVRTQVTAQRTFVLHRDASQNVGHVVRQDPGASPAFEGTLRRWSAFGTLRSGSSALERGYASQAAEGASGLILMGARHYDPATGRFLQPDPLGIAASELYAYAANNPYVFWDPTGLAPISFSGAAWGAVGDIAAGVGTAAASIFLPGVGEYLDYQTLRDPGAAGWEKAVAAVGLGLGAYTAGASPNASGVIRGGREVASGLSDLASVSGDLLSYASREADDLLRYVHPNNWDAALGRPTSGAFRGSEVSVFSTAGGATPEAVLRAMNAPAGSRVVAVPRASAEGLVEIRRSPGATGNPVLDAAHYDLLNVSKSPARKLAETCRVVGGC